MDDFRRWKVVLWGIKLENSFPDNSINAFVEFDVGGDREEVRVKSGNKQKVYAVGELKNRLRTSVAYACKTGDPPIELDYRVTFEYRGSYLDVEAEKMKIRVRLETEYNLSGATHFKRIIFKYYARAKAPRRFFSVFTVREVM